MRREETINSGNAQVGGIRFNELAEYYLKVEFDPEVTASPKSENTKPILQHYVRDILIAKWGGQIAEDIEPLEITCDQQLRRLGL